MLFRSNTAAEGEKIYKQKNCNTCHSVDGSPMTGPSFKGIWGTQQALNDGTSVLVDENFVRESIVNPQAKIAKGFGPLMPSYQGLVAKSEMEALFTYLKSIK